MQSKLVLLALAASASAVVDINYAALLPAALKRRAAELAPRQTSSSSGSTPAIPSGCLSAVSEVAASFPSPPPDVQSAIATLKESNICSFTPPSSLSSDFSKFSSQVVSWASANSDKLSSCTALASLSPVTACGKNAQSSGTAAASSSSSSSSSSSKSSNSGARETGLAMAAVAAAGFAVATL